MSIKTEATDSWSETPVTIDELRKSVYDAVEASKRWPRPPTKPQGVAFAVQAMQLRLEGTSIAVRPFSLTLTRVSLEEGPFQTRFLKVAANVIGEPDGRVIEVMHGETTTATTEEQLAHEVFEALRELVTHELTEKVFFRGRPLRDPHPERPRFGLLSAAVGGELDEFARMAGVP